MDPRDSDPTWSWDGQHWHHWDGTAWLMWDGQQWLRPDGSQWLVWDGEKWGPVQLPKWMTKHLIGPDDYYSQNPVSPVQGAPGQAPPAPGDHSSSGPKVVGPRAPLIIGCFGAVVIGFVILGVVLAAMQR